jgi:hypothetical protein
MKELAPSLRQSGGAFLLKTAKHIFHISFVSYQRMKNGN